MFAEAIDLGVGGVVGDFGMLGVVLPSWVVRRREGVHQVGSELKDMQVVAELGEHEFGVRGFVHDYQNVVVGDILERELDLDHVTGSFGDVQRQL